MIHEIYKTTSGAWFSTGDGAPVPQAQATFRHVVWRRWDLLTHSEISPPAVFCLINPSKAGAYDPDPTLTKVCGFAKLWGAGGAIIINAYDRISTDPKQLDHLDVLRSSVADLVIDHVVKSFGSLAYYGVVCGWGQNTPSAGHADVVRSICGTARQHGVSLTALKTNQDGSPGHPLYLPYRLVPVAWSPA